MHSSTDTSSPLCSTAASLSLPLHLLLGPSSSSSSKSSIVFFFPRKIVICSTWIVIAVDKETLDMLTALGMGDIPGVRLESTELQAAPVGYGRDGPKRCYMGLIVDVILEFRFEFLWFHK
ncbi:hypothetical protein ACLB2K_034179 [Fragaria x ananassa]